MSQAPIPLLEVDEAQITIIVDNSLDLLMAGSDVARRYPLRADLFERAQPQAEHGFSALIHLKRGEKTGTILFDTGISPQGILHNMDALEIRPGETRAIIVSHGHADHTMGLLGLLTRLGTRKLPLVLHPDAYLERKIVLPTGMEINLPPPRKSDLQRENIEVIEEVGPSLLVEGMLLVSGEVARTTDFEQGFPIHYAKRHDAWEPDPLIHDDQCAIIHVRGKGLVIVTGCGHAGIVNIIRNAQRLTGIQTIYAVVGGFHLTGAIFEPIIPATIAALEQFRPRYLMPCHCTGWKAVHQIARTMPEAFIASSVGTTLVL
ncbi:MAG TPA: MBL fold metallo-hydrolase [Ktedonobacterales bacterium]